MNKGQIVHPRIWLSLAGFTPSLATIAEATKTYDDYGDEQKAWQAVLSDVACVIAPSGGSYDRHERRTTEATYSEFAFVAILAGAFPQVEIGMRATVDDAEYAIVGVTIDSRASMTRLSLEVVT